jgi:hypothetical protein
MHNEVVKSDIHSADAFGLFDEAARSVSGVEGFGQVPKSLFILQVIDDPVLRQAKRRRILQHKRLRPS